MFKKPLIPVLILTLALSSLCAKLTFAASIESDEAAAYANFIQNLVTKSTVTKKGAFCIFGHDAVARSLAGGAGNVVIRDDGADAYRKCRAVYISVESIANLKSRLGEMMKDKILTISTFEEFVENGGMIQVGMGRRDFELTVDVKLLYAAQIKLDTLSTNLIVN